MKQVHINPMSLLRVGLVMAAIVAALAVSPAFAHGMRQRPAPATQPHPRQAVVLFPTRSEWAKLKRTHRPDRDFPAPNVAGSGNLNYNGGLVQRNPVSYAIFWGSSWKSADSGTAAIILSWFRDYASTSFENILTQYYDGDGNINATHTLGGAYFDSSAPPTDSVCTAGLTVEDSSVRSEVTNAIAANGWPTDDTNAVYYVYLPVGLSLYDPSAGCSALAGGSYCAYHTWTGSFEYGAMPYPASDCQVPTSPNGNFNGDSLASLTSHEQAESITDPYPPGSGWIDSAGYEIGDKCAWDFSAGLTHMNNNGTFEVQTEYSNASSSCVNSYGGVPTGSVNPSYANHAEYVIGADGRMYLYLYQPSTNWKTSAVSGSESHLQGNVASYDLDGCHFAYAVDTSHHLQEYYRCDTSGNWSHQDLSSIVGVQFTGSPNGYAYNDPTTNAGRHSISVVGTDGDLYNVNYTPSTNWKATAVSSAATFTGTPSGYAVVGATSAYELVYVVSTAGGVYEFSFSEGSWSLVNHWATLTSGVTAAGSVSAYTFEDAGYNQDHAFYAVGTNGHLYQFVYHPSTNWRSYDVTHLSGSSASLVGTPSGHASYQSPTLHLVYTEDADGSLEEFVSAEGTNTWTTYSLGSGGINGALESYSYEPFDTTTLTHIVFYPGTDGRLHEAVYQPSTNWKYLDLGVPASGTIVASGANGYGF